MGGRGGGSVPDAAAPLLRATHPRDTTTSEYRHPISRYRPAVSGRVFRPWCRVPELPSYLRLKIPTIGRTPRQWPKDYPLLFPDWYKEKRKKRVPRDYSSVRKGLVPVDFMSPWVSPAGTCPCCGLKIPDPTPTIPGTPERVQILFERRRMGYCLWHTADARRTQDRVAYRGLLDMYGNFTQTAIVDETCAGPQVRG